jgi:hypothetical protein
MVGPTKLKPSAFRAFDMACDWTLRSRTGRRREGPQESRETLRRLDPQEGLRATDRAFDLAAVADDPGVCQKPCDVGFAPGGDGVRVKAEEGRAEVVALAQDGDPRKARLEAFQDQKLEQAPGIAFGAAPFVVMVGLIQRISAAPGASRRIFSIFHGRACGFAVAKIRTKCET